MLRIINRIRWARERGWWWVLKRIKTEFISPTTPFIRSVRKFFLGFSRNRGALTRCKTSKGYKADASNLVFFLDLQICPIAFDVVSYLAAAELARRRQGLKSIHVVIVPGHEDGMRQELPEYDAVVDLESRRWRINHLVVPALTLLPACNGYTLCPSREHARLISEYLSEVRFPADWDEALPSRPQRRWIFDASRAGEKIYPLLVAPTSALRYVDQFVKGLVGGSRLIVITLRQYQYTPARNSNIKAWAAFAGNLNLDRYTVIFVMDTEEAMNPVPDAIKPFHVFLPASWNLVLRMALYERAYLNLAIAQGPMELCWYNNLCSYLIFFPLNSAPLTSESPVRAEGFDIGGDLPFSRPGQHFVWERDDLDIINREFEQIVPVLEANYGSY